MKVSVEDDSFDINVKMRFSKSLETIPDTLFNEVYSTNHSNSRTVYVLLLCVYLLVYKDNENSEMRAQIESHIGGVDTDSVLEHGTYPLSAASQDEKDTEDVEEEEEEEEERQRKDVVSLSPNCLTLKAMGYTSPTTSGQNSEYMAMDFSTGNISHHLDYPEQNVVVDFDAEHLYPKDQSCSGNLFVHGVQTEIGMEADFDPMSGTEIPFQAEEERDRTFVFGQSKSAAGCDDSGAADGDGGGGRFSGSDHMCDGGDRATAADQGET